MNDTVYALARSNSTLYAARASGLYHSQDGGETWQQSFDEPLTVTAVTTIGQTILAGINGGIARSVDGGTNWQFAALTTPPPLVAALAAASDGIVIAATAQDGVLVSSDHGTSWTAWNFGLIDPNVYALLLSPTFSADQTVMIGTESGIFRSQNGGRGWHETHFPLDAAPVLSLGLTPSGRWLAGTENNGLWASDDGGMNWQPIEIDGLSSAVNAILTAVPATIYLLLENTLLRSMDDGRSWLEHCALAPALTMLLDGGAIRVGLADGTILKIDL